MDDLDHFELKVLEVTGDMRIALASRDFIKARLDAGDISPDDLAECEIEYREICVRVDDGQCE
jgi:hypothetical protein